MSTNPYASPAGDAGELRIGTGQQRPPWPYRPAGLLTAWLTGVLWALIAAYFAALALQIVGATVLADDLTTIAPDRIKDIRIVRTVTGGQVMYQA